MQSSTCLNCGSSDVERPLIPLKFQGREIHICPQCLPILIHKPYQLADKLPGIKSYENPPDQDR
jgi:hypothetical protein